jgi:Double-GTPase 1
MSNQPTHPISIIGLPGSGKTTFLAALWHLVQSVEVDTRLKFGGLRQGDFHHLNEIAKRWRSAMEQDRTQIAGMKTVSMDLIASDRSPVRLTFPDVPGEDYQQMWENRTVGVQLAETLSNGNVMLLVNGVRMAAPRWIHEDAELSRKLNLPRLAEDVPWSASLSPKQVQLVEMLQSLRQPPLDCGPRRIAIIISLWDRAAGAKLQPEPFMEVKFPLLHQYLSSGRDGWDWRVYGVSAQGGEYDSAQEGVPLKPEAETLRDQDMPSKRIRLVTGETESHDLTEPLEWLMF